jgi:predicted nucleic acid-binding protein
MKVFIDANILVTVLNKEFPSFPDCAKLLSLADKRKFELLTSPMCLAISFYFAQKKCDELIAKQKIALLVSKMSVSDNNKHDVLKALENNQIHDFEDGLEYYSALSSKCKCIVTNDIDDFHFSEIEVLKPQDFLVKFAVR